MKKNTKQLEEEKKGKHIKGMKKSQDIRIPRTKSPLEKSQSSFGITIPESQRKDFEKGLAKLKTCHSERDELYYKG